MARDPILERFTKRRKEQQLSDLAKKARSKQDIEAEEKLIKDAKKVEPIKND